MLRRFDEFRFEKQILRFAKDDKQGRIKARSMTNKEG
jgi:hypothetical protein